jgi:hypothetical protein
MRLKHVIAVTALALVGGTAAHADIVVTLNSPGPLTPGNTYTISGTIQNTFSDSVLIDGTSGPPVPPIQDFNDIFLNALQTTLGGELDLAGGASSGPLDFYSFKASSPTDPIQYAVTGEFTSGTAIGSPVSGLGTIGAAAIPEPGSIAMLLGGALSGGLFLARRRRK